MKDRLSVRECKEEISLILNKLYWIEDNTNYDVKPLGKAIDLLQRIDLDKEFKKIIDHWE